MNATIQPTTKEFVQYCKRIGRCNVKYSANTTTVHFNNGLHIAGAIHSIYGVSILMKSMVEVDLDTMTEFKQFVNRLGMC